MIIAGLQATRLIHKSQLLFYMPAMNKWTWKTIYLIIPKMKCLGINLKTCTRYMWEKLKNSDERNQRTKKTERHSTFMDRKTWYYQDASSTQLDLLIQSQSKSQEIILWILTNWLLNWQPGEAKDPE